MWKMPSFLISEQIYMNNILVTGAGGQLGSELKRLERNYPNYKIFFADNYFTIRRYCTSIYFI